MFFSPRAKQPRTWLSNSQVPVKWPSPLYFTATSPATSPSIERIITEINQMNRPEERNCARPRPRVRRERPHPLTHGASRLPCGRSRLRVVKIAPHAIAAKEFCQTICMRRRIRLVRQDCTSKGDNQLPLLKSQPKQPKSAAIQIRVEEDVKLRLDKYAEFIDSSAAYVVTEALKLLFNKDVEFKSWLGQHTYNSEAQPPSSKVAVSKGESVQLALK
jgi:hypothetical protein